MKTLPCPLGEARYKIWALKPGKNVLHENSHFRVKKQIFSQKILIKPLTNDSPLRYFYTKFFKIIV